MSESKERGRRMISIFYQLSDAINNVILKLVLIAIVSDTVFGIIRAIKERKFNSTFGIDGAIRKVSMVLCLVFCTLVDITVDLNFIGFLPDFILTWLDEYLHIGHIGLCQFFGIIFIGYEVTSILKNMTLCGLPLKGIFLKVYNFLRKYTDELPSGIPEEINDSEAKKAVKIGEKLAEDIAKGVTNTATEEDGD